MKLIPMVDFVLSQDQEYNKPTPTYAYKVDLDNYKKVVNYANFLKQPLKLGMFVPCDKEGNVLEEPNCKDYIVENSLTSIGVTQDLHIKTYNKDIKKYQQAKDRVLFEGLKVELVKSGDQIYYLVKNDLGNIWASWNTSKTIEDLIPYDLTLTKTVIEQIKE